MSSELNPYASPQSEQAPPVIAPKANPYSPGRTRGFEPANTPGNIAVVVILISMAIDVVVIVFRWFDIEMIEQIIGGQQVSQEEAIANESRILLAERVRLLAVVVAAIPFLTWLYRSHRNLGALAAAPLNYTPGWTIGGWFIPFGNLFIPYMVVQEVHRGSDPYGFGESKFLRLGQRSIVVMLWWFFWIASGILAQIGVAMFMGNSVGQPDLESLRIAAWLLEITSLTRIAAGICIMQAMYAIMRNQLERYEIAVQAEAATPKFEVGFAQ